MARDNEKRLQAADDAVTEGVSASEEQKAEEKKEIDLSFPTPSEFVDLPSGGKFYSKDSPLRGKKSVEIKFMTAAEEDILTNKSYIRKGVAIDRLLESVILDKSVKVDDMLIGDKNALLVATRINGYGPEYDTKVTCPVCIETNKFTFNLEEQQRTEGGITDELKEKGVEDVGDGIFKMKLPVSQFNVEIRLLAGADEKKLMHASEYRKKNKLKDAGTTDQFKLMLVSVEGYGDTNVISKFVSAMPAKDARFMRDVYRKLSPNVDMTQTFTCSNCDHEEEMEVPFSTDFFWFK